MKVASGHLAVEVELSTHDVPLVEYDAGKDGTRDVSCYVGIAAGAHLQINLRFKGTWKKALCDIVIDGVLCRVVTVEGSGPMSKFVDQVWILEHDQMQYARMAVETVAPSCESSQRTAVDKGTIWEQLTRSLRQRVSILVYGIEAVGIHRVTLPHILDIDGQSSSALLTSPTYVASSSDPERTHRIKLLSIGGPSKRIIGWHADRFRRGYEPFATFNFDYRDSNLLKQLDLPVSANKCVDLLQATKRTYDAFLEDRNDARSCQPARKAVKLEDSLGRLSPVTGSLYEEQDSRLHDGYGPGSYYRARESRPRRSTGANIIPVASCHTSIVPHLSLDHEESLRRDSHSPLTKVMPTGPTASAAFNRVDQRITHLPSINTLSGQGDPRRVKQPQSLLNTPRSPPAHAVGTQTIAFQAMSQELYEARISLVAMPMEFVKMNAANRKIMPIALLRIKEKEDEKEEQRDWERSETPSGRFH